MKRRRLARNLSVRILEVRQSVSKNPCSVGLARDPRYTVLDINDASELAALQAGCLECPEPGGYSNSSHG